MCVCVPLGCPMTSSSPHHPDIGQVAAILSTLPVGTILSHRSAAQLWGLWLPRFDGIEVTTPATERGSRYTTAIQRHSVLAHRRRVRPSDVTTRHGLPVTSVSRTWIDAVATCADIHDAVAVGDSALRAGASIDDLVKMVRRSRGVRGVRLARDSIELVDSRSRSRPESRIRSALVVGGLPWPKVNESVHDRYGQWLAEPDLLYREARLALEYNGAHHGGIGQLRRDSARLLDLQRAGWEVRTYTARHAFDGLDEVVADVRDLLLRRAPELMVRAQLGGQPISAARRVTDAHDGRRHIRRHSA